MCPSCLVSPVPNTLSVRLEFRRENEMKPIEPGSNGWLCPAVQPFAISSSRNHLITSSGSATTALTASRLAACCRTPRPHPRHDVSRPSGLSQGSSAGPPRRPLGTATRCAHAADRLPPQYDGSGPRVCGRNSSAGTRGTPTGTTRSKGSYRARGNRARELFDGFERLIAVSGPYEVAPAKTRVANAAPARQAGRFRTTPSRRWSCSCSMRTRRQSP